MSSQTNTQALIVENARLSAQVTVSASTIKDLQHRIGVLEQIIGSLEVEKRLAGTKEADPALKAEISDLKNRLGAKDATIASLTAQLDAEKSRNDRSLRISQEVLTGLQENLTAVQDMVLGMEGKEAEDTNSKPPEISSDNASIGTAGSPNRGHPAPMTGSTPAHFTAEVDPASTGHSQQTYAQAIQSARGTTPRERGRVHFAQWQLTHADLPAKKEQTKKPQQNVNSNSGEVLEQPEQSVHEVPGGNRGGPGRGRGGRGRGGRGWGDSNSHEGPGPNKG